MRPHEQFHKALAYVIGLVSVLLIISGFFVPMMVEQGGAMAAYGIPVLGLCMSYLVAMGTLRAIQAYKRMLRSRD